MLTDQQIEQRLKFVTGSDSSVILGVNPYESIIDLWQYKLGLKEKHDISHNPRVAAGNYLESAVAKMFEDSTGKKTIESPDLIVHPQISWMAGNIDRAIGGENAILEIKTASSGDKWGEQGTDVIPLHYLCQISHYMAITGAARCYVAVLIGGWDFRHYNIERNLKLEEILIEKEKFFWEENVLKEIPPEPRCLEDVVKLCRGRVVPDPVVASPDVLDLVNGLKAIKEQKKDLEQREAETKNKIALFMREHEALASPYDGSYILTWKHTKDSEHFNKEIFKKEHPALYNEYLFKYHGARRFVLKGENL